MMKTFAYLVRRFFAFGADWYISAILINLLANGISKLLPIEHSIHVAIIISSLVVSYLYFVLVPIKVWKGQTLMKRMMYLKVISDNDSCLNVCKLIVRYFVGCLILEGVIFIPSSNIRSALLLIVPSLEGLLVMVNYAMMATSGLSLVMMLIDYKHNFRMLHDRISHTKVVDYAKIS